jgi:hypothetical protein
VAGERESATVPVLSRSNGQRGREHGWFELGGNFLVKIFPIKDIGLLNFFLGVEVQRSSAGLHLSQQQYIADILTQTNMQLAKPISSPMSAASLLSKFDGTSMSNPTLFRSTIGALHYLSLTRPDIAFAVNKVSQFSHSPHDVHWAAIKRSLRYL